MFVLRGFEMHGRRFLSFLHCAFVRSWLKGLYLTLHDLTQRSIWENMNQKLYLLHFAAFFHVASLFSTGVDNKKVGVDNEKALKLTNSTVFHRGRQ